MKKKSNRTMRKSRPIVQRAKKNLRSKLPRHSQRSPILCTSRRPIVSREEKAAVPTFRKFPADSSCSSHFPGEISSNSTGFSVESHDLSARRSRKRVLDEIQASRAPARREDWFRRVTRRYSKEKENRRIEVEASESSCVESSTGAEARGLGEQSSKAKSTEGEGAETVKETEDVADAEAMSRSEISCVEQLSTANEESAKKARISKDNGGLEEVSEAKFQSVCSSVSEILSESKAAGDRESRASELKFCEASKSCFTSNSIVSKSESTAEKKPRSSGWESDLLCAERLSYDDVSDDTSSLETTLSKVFPENSEGFSDYSPSIWLESSIEQTDSEFSEKSQEDSTPSPTYSLFRQFSRQFCRLSSPIPSESAPRDGEEHRDEFILLRFKDVDDEESYQKFRNRERRRVFARNYGEYCPFATDSGNLAIDQRLQIVHWIVQQSTSTELQNETMFLGIKLFDRFLSKGFFKSSRSLQIVGIACLVLATRIEEKQPLNTVRQDTFYIGSNAYDKSEVVAMEWLVQKVLNYQCFLPTIYNFLWFYLKAAKANAEVEKRAKYLAVLALLDHEQLRYWPSTVAAGLVILACLAANQEASCQWVMETHVRTKDDDLAECIKSLEWLVKYVYCV